MVETGFMQVSFIVKPYFFDIFLSDSPISAHELSFYKKYLKIKRSKLKVKITVLPWRR